MGLFDFFTKATSNKPEIINKPVAPFSEFDGTQKMFEKMWCKYAYEQCDIQKTEKFQEYICNNYKNTQFDYSFQAAVNSWFYGDYLKFKEQGAASFLKERVQGRDIDDLCYWVTLCYLGSFLGDAFGEREFNIKKFLYIYNKDIAKIQQLTEYMEKLPKGRQDDVKVKIKKITNKYDGNVGCDYYLASKIIELTNLEHLTEDIKNFVGKYSIWVDEIYTLILNSAIRNHNINKLSNLLPSNTQKETIRRIVAKEIMDAISVTFGDLEELTSRAQKCSAICKELQSLNDKYNEANNGQGALTVGLTLVNPLLGVANAIRVGYNNQDIERQYQKLNDELNKEFDSFLSDYYFYCNAVYNYFYNEQIPQINDKISLRYLKPSILDIAKKINDAGYSVKSLDKYL